jgi:hypothetical protein
MENLLSKKEICLILNKEDRKKCHEAFFAFAYFSEEHPEGRISHLELK